MTNKATIKYAATILGRKGGASTSEAKIKAARENGKKGGRPCSHANTDGSARPWELRRFKAGHACHSCGRTLGTDGYWYIDADQAPGYPFDKTALEQRRKILETQAEDMRRHYEESLEKYDLETGEVESYES